MKINYENFTKKKLLPIIIILIMVIEMFSPYSVLLTKVYADVDPTTDTLIAVTVSDPYTVGKQTLVKVTYAITAENVASIDFSIGYDSTKLKPANRKTGAEYTTATIGTGATSCVEWGTLATDYFDTDTKKLTVPTGDSTTGNIRIALSEPSGGVLSLDDEGYSSDDLGEDANGYDYYMEICTMYFIVVDYDEDTYTGVTTTDLFWSPVGSGMPTGFKYIYNNGGSNQTVVKTDGIAYEGFYEESKAIKEISVKTNPTNTTYNHGDSISLAGGVITVYYDDGTSEDVSMTDSSVNIKSGSLADVSKTTVTITYAGKEASFGITVNDPVDSLAIKSSMTKVEYNHGENFDFTGLQLTATKRSGATETLTASSTGITISETTASVNSSAFTQTSSAEALTVSGTQKITFTYEGKTADTTVVVNDTIASINVKNQPSKTIYKYGESLDLSGAVVEVVLGSGATTNINLPDGSVTVSGYSSTITGSKQNLSVSLGSIVATQTIDVEVYDYVESSVLTAPTTTTYDYNTSLSLAGGKLRLTYKSGSSSNVSLTSSMVSGYDPTDINVQLLTVTYNVDYNLSDGSKITDTIVKTFEVEVVNSVKSISITAPSKTTYNHGESLDLTGGAILVTYADGSTNNVTMTANMITESSGSSVNMSPLASEYGSDYTLAKTLQIKYKEDSVTQTENYAITIINDVKTISMKTTPKTSYNVNESFDITGGEIEIVRAVGDASTVSMTNTTQTGFDSSSEGKKEVTVSYTENGVTKSTSYNVTVTDTVTAIVIEGTPKTDYKYNEELTYPQIQITKGSGTSTITTEASMITGYDKTTLGEQTVTITYGGQSTTYKVNVKDYVTSITVDPATVTGKYNDTLSSLISANSIKYTVTYAKAGAQSGVTLTESMVNGYSATSLTEQNLTVTYRDNDTNSATNGTDFTANLSVTLQDTISSITVTAPTLTQTYNHGANLDLTGAKITVNYASGATPKDVTPTASMVFEQSTSTRVSMAPTSYDSTNKVTKTVTLKYTEDGVTGSADFQIEIINDVQSISIHTIPKTAYNVNDTLDITNGEILVTRAVGTPEVISMTNTTQSGFSSLTEGTKTVTVSYTENGVTKETSYNVTVTDSVTAIAIDGTPKTDYKYNEELEYPQIQITKGSGTSTITTEASMITGYDKTILGEQTVTITYGGKTATYQVNVKDYVTGISVNPATVTGKYNDTLSSLISTNNIVYIVTYAKAGAKPATTLEELMVNGYSETSLTEQNLTVTYRDNDTNSATNGTDFTASLSVTLQDTISSITVTAPTSTQSYNHGANLDLTGAKITVNYTSGAASKDVTPTASMVFEQSTSTQVSMAPTSYDSTNKVTKTVTLKYTEDGVTGSADFQIEIINDIQSISMKTTPKTSYNIGDSIDITNGEIEVTRANGSTSIVSMSNTIQTGFDSSLEGTKEVTVSYTENGVTKTTSYNVIVTDTVTSIAIDGTPKTDYKYNEELEYPQIQITKGSGTSTITTEASMITGYDKTILGEQTVTITYGGKTATYKVNVKDYVTSITVDPATVTGKYNDTLLSLISANNIQYTVTYAKAGAKPTTTLEESMVNGYSATSLTEQNLTVTYRDTDTNSATNETDFTANLSVTLQDTVSSITVIAPTSTQTYNHGANLDLTGATITVNYTSGAASKDVTPTASMVFEQSTSTEVSMAPTSYDSTNKVTKTVTLKYTEDGVTGSADFQIEIINDIQSISMKTTPKTSYNIGDSINITNGEIEVTRANGSTSIVSMSNTIQTGFDSSSEGTKEVTVSYTENGVTKTTSYNITVTDTVTSITIEGTPKTDYKYNEELEYPQIQITKGSGTSTITVDASMVSGYDKTTLGEQTLTITYGGQSTTFKVNVKDYVTSITVDPATVTGNYNDLLSSLISANNIQYIVTYAKAGAQAGVTLTESMVNGYSETSLIAQNLTVTYTDTDTNSATNGTDFTANLSVTLQDQVVSTVITAPTKTIYKYGENLSLDGAEITITYQSGQIVTVSVTDNMVTEADGNAFASTTLGTRDLTITYNGTTKNYSVTVEDYVTGVVLTAPTKLSYDYGESLELAGGSIQKVMASGTIANSVPLTDSQVSVSAFNPTQIGSQTITVTYEGQSQSFGVTVADNIQSIAMKTTPTKTTYKYGESLDLTNGEIEITRTSGSKETVSITSSMVTGFNPNQLGEQTLTVTYNGETTTYKVTVEDYITDITITPPTKQVYKLNETPDFTGGTVTVVMASGQNNAPIDMTDASVTVQDFDTSTVGAKTITVTYEGITKTFGITVADELTGVVLNTYPNKVDYLYGESLDLTGATLELTKESGATEIINVTSDMISGYNPKQLGNQTVTVTYEGVQNSFIVNVEDYVAGLEIKAPDKVDYEYGESLDLDGGQVSIMMASGAVKETTELTASMVSGFNSKQEGTQTIKVEYKDLVGEFKVKVVDEVKGISLNTKPDKTDYEYNEDIDLTGATITVVKSSGITTIPVTKDMVSNYSATTPGTQVITITYDKFTTKFIVVVGEKPEDTKEENPSDDTQEPEEEKPVTVVTKPTGTTVKPTTTVVDSTAPSTDINVDYEPEEDLNEIEEIISEDENNEDNTEEEITTPAVVVEEIEDTNTLDTDKTKTIAKVTLAVAILLLLILIFTKKNVKIYVEEDGEFVLGGLDKITKKDPYININKYLDGETYPNKVRIVLNDSISEKLDKKEITIKHRKETIKIKVEYKDEPYEIILD